MAHRITEADRQLGADRRHRLATTPELVLEEEVDREWHREPQKAGRRLAILQVPPNYRGVAIEAWKGSYAAAVRFQCLRCRGYVPRAIRNCEEYGCPVYGLRPYAREWTVPRAVLARKLKRRQQHTEVSADEVLAGLGDEED